MSLDTVNKGIPSRHFLASAGTNADSGAFRGVPCTERHARAVPGGAGSVLDYSAPFLHRAVSLEKGDDTEWCCLRVHRLAGRQGGEQSAVWSEKPLLGTGNQGIKA